MRQTANEEGVLNEFDLQRLIADLRAAASDDNAHARVREIMISALRDPLAVQQAMAGFSGEEEILFEDDSLTVMYCGFDPAKHVPPHDHRMNVTIGVYAGGEVNHFYLAGERGLERRSSRELGPGDVMQMGPDAIHSVETSGDGFSYAIHVYLGRLKQVERALYDWDDGTPIPFSDANFTRLERRRVGAGGPPEETI